MNETIQIRDHLWLRCKCTVISMTTVCMSEKQSEREQKKGELAHNKCQSLMGL